MQKSEQVTIVMMTYKRNDLLSDPSNPTLSNLCKLPIVDKLVLIWHNLDCSIPESVINNFTQLGIIDKVKVVFPPENTLNNRFYPWNEIETDCILSIDDDYYVDELGLYDAHKSWLENKDCLFSFAVRYASAGNYATHPNGYNNLPFNIALTGCALFHRKFMHHYFDEQYAAIRAQVNKEFNGEDIAFNFIYQNNSQELPQYVLSHARTWKQTKGISSGMDHYKKRISIYNFLVDYFPDFELKASRIKHFISSPQDNQFQSTNYWVDRYQQGGNSGAGSYDKLAKFKANILNHFVYANGVTSVLEAGSGDGQQLKLAQYPRYFGYDVSNEMVVKCKGFFQDDPSKRFLHFVPGQTNLSRIPESDLALSLDVVYHLIEDSVFEEHLRLLFAKSKRYVVIYASNQSSNHNLQPNHVKHRKFSDWIDENIAGWRLKEINYNEYPQPFPLGPGSFADFYIYEKITAEEKPLFPEVRTLIFALGPRHKYRGPLYSRSEVFAGPDVPTQIGGDGLKTINTPKGEFDAREIIKQLPPEQQPELIVVKADATGLLFPRNLAYSKAIKVLVLGNTQHLLRPIQRVLKYAQSEPFDTLVSDHKAHHLHFFKEAGLKNIHWIPGLNYKLLYRVPQPNPSIPLSFVGQVGKYHPYRKAVLSELNASKIPLQIVRADQHVAADIYADSEITLNVSLNGDLNLRIFEALGAGGFLLTDRLADESGLEHLFQSGVHLETFSDVHELKEKIFYYSNNPEKRESIRLQGQSEVLKNHNPSKKAHELMNLAINHVETPEYVMDFDTRALTVQGASLVSRLPFYEFLQEQHLNNQQIQLHAPKTIPAGYLGDCRDLPRIDIHEFVDLPDAEIIYKNQVPCILIIDGDSISRWLPIILMYRWHAVLAVQSENKKLIKMLLSRLGYREDKNYPKCFVRLSYADKLHDAYKRQPEEVIRLLEGYGLGQTDEDAKRDRSLSVLLAGDPLTEAELIAKKGGGYSSQQALVYSRDAEKRRLTELQEFFLKEAIGLDRSNSRAYLDYSGLLFSKKRLVECIICLKEAFRLQELPEKLQAMLREFEENPEFKDSALDVYHKKIGQTAISSSPYKLKILVVTNLLPPQEMGGFGRTVWEFCDLLIKRGHDLRILCGDMPHLKKSPDADHERMEKYIQRELTLFGDWRDGYAVSEKDPNKIRDICINNHARILGEVEQFRPDVCMAGNLDYIGAAFLQEITKSNIPVLHRLGNENPGFPIKMTPDTDLYCLAGCSQWLNNRVRDQGYPVKRYAVVYPGSPLGAYFKPFSPKLNMLRICFAGLLMPYKGSQVLVEALGYLKKINIPFTCEFAGDTTSPQFVKELKRMAKAGNYLDQLKFSGFLGKKELAALYARSNVMVFPSVFDEPFGKSQIEAMAAGLCVVSSGTGGSKEIVRDGINGLIFERRNSEDLARQLFVLHSDKSLWSRLALQGQEDAYQFTTLNSVIQIENEFYGMLSL